MQHHSTGANFTLARQLRNSVAAILAVGGVLLMGCGSLQASVTEIGAQELGQRLSRKGSSLNLTIQAIESTITAGNPKLLASLIDADAVLERATSNLGGEGTDNVRKIFTEGTKQAWVNNNPANDYSGTLFRFLRVREFKGRTGLLFRAENETGSINYYLFTIGENTPGDYRIKDIFTYGLNEFASEALRRTYGHLLASFSAPEDAAKYSPIGQEYVNHLQDIANMNRAMREGRYPQAIAIWSQLPKSVQRERAVLMVRLDAAERISPEDRAAAMEQWLETYPDVMDLPLKVADYLMSQDRWEEAQKILGRVVDHVGGDSRMLFQLGQVAYHAERNGDHWVEAARLEANVEATSKAAPPENVPVKIGK